YYYVCTVFTGFIFNPPHCVSVGENTRQPMVSLSQAYSGQRTCKSRITTLRCRNCGQRNPEVCSLIQWFIVLRCAWERFHRCQICNRCLLKFDHHSPASVNQCVVLYNEPQFVFYMRLLNVGLYPRFPDHVLDLALRFRGHFLTSHGPDLTSRGNAVSCSICHCRLAPIQYMVASGETSVETQNHDQYREVGAQRGEIRLLNRTAVSWP
ncbi:hypothetical protein BD414DRAFT_404165, partial [Trametes punicea]